MKNPSTFTFVRINLSAIMMGILLLAFIPVTKAQTVQFSDSRSAQGFTLVSQSAAGVQVDFSVTGFSLDDIEVNGEAMKSVHMPGTFLPNNEGAPDLPGDGRYFAFPQGAVVSYTITYSRTETYSNVNVAPAPRLPKETEKGPLFCQKDMKIYSRNAFYPENPVRLSAPTTIRGVDAVILGVTPFKYNPVTKELIVYRDLSITLNFDGGNGQFGDSRLRSRWWDPLMKDMFLNSASLPEVQYKSAPGLDDTGFEYLIITPDNPDFIAWADTLKKWRNTQGIYTGVVTLSQIGGNSTTLIENYVNNAYNTWTIPPAAVLLMADYGTSGNSCITSPVYNSYCKSDNLYADVNGDHMPDVAFARITAKTAAQLNTMIGKMLSYERQPPMTPSFYQNAIFAGGWQTERWFTICSEVVAGYMSNVLGKTPGREYSIVSGSSGPGSSWSSNQNTSIIVNYFGPNGLGYIPATPSYLTMNGSVAGVNNRINSGAFMLLHRDHGYEEGWGEPPYSNSSLSGLNNETLPFVFSLNCLTGKFDYSPECFASAFHRMQKGALGLIAATEVSYSFVNDAYCWGLFDNLFPNFMPAYGTTPASRGVLPCFGNAAGKYFLQQSSWPYNPSDKEVTYYLFHHHGDAFLTVYSEVPQNLTVVHDGVMTSGVSTFNVTADQDALICLSVNGEIIGRGTGTGSPVAVAITPQLPGVTVLVTVTKQNYLRYHNPIQVIPPTGPYVIKDNFTISDPTGNNNGLADYGENLLVSLVVKNVGIQQANSVNVKVVSADPNVTVTDSTEVYGNIAPNSTSTVANGFAFHLSTLVPDMHPVLFSVIATDGTNTWTSSFMVTAHAPELAYGSFTLSDPAGNNNGKLDPGETATLTITVNNTGSSDASGVTAILSSADPNVTIISSSATYGNINSGGSAQQTFSVSADASTPAGHNAGFSMDIAATGGLTGSGTFNIIIGQIPVCIIDLDGNANSGPAIQTALQTNGISAEYTTTFPSNLSLYTSLFVCLGIYSNNHVLTSGEGQALADFLNAGGAIYMEGGDTWYYDSPTAVHPMFNITGTSDGSSDLGTETGQTGTMTAGMSFQYSGDNNWIDHMNPVAPAYVIFKNQSPSYNDVIAYSAAGYKTIGSSFEFGGLNNGTGISTKTQLMQQYINFFGLLSTLTANFSANNTTICAGSTVNFTDMSSGNPTSWNWTFPGGTPSNSTLQSPSVVYSTPGTYNVKLVVSNGTETDSITKQNYITVSTTPPVAGNISGNNSVCQGQNNVPYSVPQIAGATSYIWTVPAGASISGGSTSYSIMVNFGSSAASGDITVKGQNSCGIGTASILPVVVNPLPSVTMAPLGNVCANWPSFPLTGGLPAGGTYSGTGVSNNYFNPAVSGTGNFNITYSYTNGQNCTSTASTSIYVDPCTGIDEPQQGLSFDIYPNPNNGTFTLDLSMQYPGTVKVKLFNTIGLMVYEEQGVEVHGKTSRNLVLNALSQGIYYLSVENDHQKLIKKLIVH